MQNPFFGHAHPSPAGILLAAARRGAGHPGSYSRRPDSPIVARQRDELQWVLGNYGIPAGRRTMLGAGECRLNRIDYFLIEREAPIYDPSQVPALLAFFNSPGQRSDTLPELRNHDRWADVPYACTSPDGTCFGNYLSRNVGDYRTDSCGTVSSIPARASCIDHSCCCNWRILGH